MKNETALQRIEKRSGEVYIVMATMTVGGAIICHCGSPVPELVAGATRIVIGGIIGMAIFGVIQMYSRTARVIRR